MRPDLLSEKVFYYFFIFNFLIDSRCKGDVYFYSVVIHLEKLNIITPVCEFLNSTHDVVSISFPLMKFARDLKIHFARPPLFKSITVDFSLAMLNGVCLGFNGMDLNSYFDIVYDELQGCKSLCKNVINTLFFIICLVFKNINLCCSSDKSSLLQGTKGIYIKKQDQINSDDVC